MPELDQQSLTTAHLSAIVENSSDAIISIDLEGKIESWNAAAERMYGWSASEMIGEDIWPLIPLDLRDEENTILEQVRNGELVSRFETVRLAKDGEPIPVTVTVSPVRGPDGTVIGASKISADLREQYDLRHALRESQRHFSALAQNIPQLAWMANATGWMFWYNQRWYDYTGTSFENMQGWGWREVHHPDHVDRVVEKIQHAWDTGEPWEDTFPLRGADGNYRWFLSRAQPIHDKSGKVILWCGTNTDITEEREANERIRLLMREVNHRARNMLSTIQAIVHRTVKDESPQLVRSIMNRIGALSANLDLLSESSWTGASVGDIVRSQIEHLGEQCIARMRLTGPDDLMLATTSAEALGLTIHELATNAEKHGALAVPDGRVEINWDVSGEGSDQTFDLHWREHDGPPVTPPDQEGFGTILLTRYPEKTMHGRAIVDYAVAGLQYSLSAPAGRVLARAGLDASARHRQKPQ